MISVVLVTFNSSAVLPQCLESLAKCSMAKSLEIVLVDNSSTDHTWAWVEQYSREGNFPFESLKTLHLHENRGYAFANNRGVEISSGDLLLLLNPDTIVGKMSIEVCADVLLSDIFVGAIGCRLELGNGQLDKACRRSFPTLWNSFARLSRLSIVFPKSPVLASYNLTYLDDRQSYEVDCLCGAFLMMHRSDYVLIGGLDEDYFMYGEDIDLCYRLKKMGYKVWYEGTQTTVHLKGGNGGKKSALSLLHFYDTMFIYFKKNHAQKYPYVFICCLKILLTILYRMHLNYNNSLSLLNRLKK